MEVVICYIFPYAIFQNTARDILTFTMVDSVNKNLKWKRDQMSDCAGNTELC